MDKFSELKDALEFLEETEFDGEWDSALVGGENGKNYHAVINANDVVVRSADDSRHTSWLCDYLEAVSPVKIRALLEQLEAKDKRIAELEQEPTIKHMRSVEEALISATDRASELEAKLATPVRLPEKFSMLHRTDFHEDYHSTMAFKSVEIFDAIRAAGFTFTVGDE